MSEEREGRQRGYYGQAGRRDIPAGETTPGPGRKSQQKEGNGTGVVKGGGAKKGAREAAEADEARLPAIAQGETPWKEVEVDEDTEGRAGT